MRIPILFRGILVALIALFGVGLQSANADSGSITRRFEDGAARFGAPGREPDLRCPPNRTAELPNGEFGTERAA